MSDDKHMRTACEIVGAANRYANSDAELADMIASALAHAQRQGWCDARRQDIGHLEFLKFSSRREIAGMMAEMVASMSQGLEKEEKKL